MNNSKNKICKKIETITVMSHAISNEQLFYLLVCKWESSIKETSISIVQSTFISELFLTQLVNILCEICKTTYFDFNS